MMACLGIIFIPILISSVLVILKRMKKIDISWGRVYFPVSIMLLSIAFLAFGLVIVHFGSCGLQLRH